MTPRRPTAALLMEHQAFLKRLARSLVFDDQRADDVVQDSFVVALERPMPAPARLRGWLAGIVRNKARRSHRSERRLRERHEHGARSEALPSAADMAARLEAQRTIAAAVEALDEPGRSVLVYRYFDGRKTAKIARDLGIPVRTVESRLRRAKESLREALDKQFGGRGPWQMALVPLIGGAPLAAGSGTAVSAGGTSAAKTATAVGVTAMSSKAVAGFCVVAALAGAGIGWSAKPAPADTANEGVADAGADDAGTDSSGPALRADPIVGQVARINDLERDLANTKREADALRQELVAAKSGAKKVPSSEAEHIAMARALKVPRYGFKKFDQGLVQIDWKKSAAAIHELGPLLPDIMRGMASRTISPELEAKAQELNAPLIQVAMILKGASVPGTGYNGPFTHPAVAANMVYATLVEAGLPLDDDQVEKLKKIGDTHAAEEAALRKREADEPFQIAILLAESDLKDRFYKAVDAILTPEQLNILHPGQIRDRVQGDLFSAGLIWLGHAQAAIGSNRADIAKRLTDLAIRQFQIPETDRAAVARLASDWMQAFDEAAIAPLDSMEMTAFIKMGRIRAAADPTLTLYKELAREMGSHPEIVKRIQQTSMVLLPALHK